MMSPLPIKEAQVQSAVSALRFAIDGALNNVSRLQARNKLLLSDQIALIGSLCDFFKDSSMIKRLTLLFQKVHNKQPLFFVRTF